MCVADRPSRIRVAVTDMDDHVRARYEYDPYGASTKTGGDIESPFLFTSHYVHQTTGLLLALFRAYDPTAGRWLSEDPAEMIDGPNLFSYVKNQPVRAIDPLGLQSYNVPPGPPSIPPLGCIADALDLCRSRNRRSLGTQETQKIGGFHPADTQAWVQRRERDE
jgi:RHS repeat-associated protein